MNQPNAYYLARDGKNSGPFTKEQIESMRGNGELTSFQWMWDPSFGNWMPLSAPPAPPSASPAASEPVRAEPVREQKSRPARAVKPRAIEAICHDNHSLVSGTLEAMTEYGCELVVRDHEAGQVFSKRVPLRLNLLDPRTGESTDISARLESVSRNEGHWTYRLRWDACPELLAG